MQVTTGARIPSELSVRQRGSGLIWLFPRAAESRARHSNAQRREHSAAPAPAPAQPLRAGPRRLPLPLPDLARPLLHAGAAPGLLPRSAAGRGHGRAGPSGAASPEARGPHRARRGRSAPGSRGAGSCSLRPGPAPAPLCPAAAAAAAPPRSGPGPPRAPPAPRARPQRPRPGREAAPAPAPLTWARAAGPART